MYGVPVFVHHEVGEKPQAGWDNRQKYVKACVSQAKKYGNVVILFGDELIESYCSDFINVDSIKSEKWNNFIECFENYSTYPDSWAKGIFKRFFIFGEYATINKIDRFFVMDSDILLYENLLSLNLWDNVDFAAEMPKRQSLLGDDHYRWTICAGVSFWTVKSINSFLDYCIDVYKNRKDLLKEKWEFHIKNHIPGGVCEMSLLYLWVSERKNLRFLNLLNIDKSYGYQFNLNILTLENYEMNQYKLNKFLGIKKLTYIESHPYFENMDRVLERTACIHFGGDSKILIEDIYRFKSIKARQAVYFACLNIKRKLGELARKIRIK